MRPKLTKIRKEILQLISYSNKPLNAKHIWKNIYSNPDVSTVYRALKFLVNRNYINTVTFSRIKFYYIDQGKKGGHFLFCDHCHEIMAFNECVVDDLQNRLQKEFQYTITSHVLCFEGICYQCKTYLENNTHPTALSR